MAVQLNDVNSSNIKHKFEPIQTAPLPHLELSLYTSKDTFMMQAAVRTNCNGPLFFFYCCLITMHLSVNLFLLFFGL